MKTYQGQNFRVEVLPSGLAYFKVNGRPVSVAKTRDPNFTRSLAIQSALVENGVISAERLARTIDSYGNRLVNREARAGNPAAVAVSGKPARLEFTVLSEAIEA